MNLAPADQAAVNDALATVRKRAQAVEQQPDLEETKLALRQLSHAVMRAGVAIDTAEFNTRMGALAKLENA